MSGEEPQTNNASTTMSSTSDARAESDDASAVRVIGSTSVVPDSFDMIHCRVCNCKILRARFATTRVTLLRAELPAAVHDAVFNSGETSADFWPVGDMYDFENVGFLKTLDGCKLITCADCEKEPLGVHLVDVEPKRYLIRVSRLKYV
jgi:hypothetical protein